MNREPNLWWSYDPDNGSFAALPAGPFFLPALIVVCIASIGNALFNPRRSREEIVGSISKTDLYRQQAARYQYLGSKRLEQGDLELREWREYYDLQFFLNNPHC